MLTRISGFLVVVACSWAAWPTFAQDVALQERGITILRDFRHRPKGMYARGMSPDGLVVIGGYDVPFTRGFVWDHESGMSAIDVWEPKGKTYGVASGVSGDGAKVVGVNRMGGMSVPFLWTEGEGLKPFDFAPVGTANIRVHAVTRGFDALLASGLTIDDGRIVPARQFSFVAHLEREKFSFLMDRRDGSVEPLKCRPVGMSSVGHVVVGSMMSDFDDGIEPTWQAFRWTEGEGVIGLGDLPGGKRQSEAHAISANGEVIVGQSGSSFGDRDDDGIEAFRWTRTGGMVGLGDLPGGVAKSQAFGVSGDGKYIVGISSHASGDEPFIWTSDSGMRLLRHVLGESGVAELPDGLDMSSAHFVSDDGAVIVGSGRDGRGNVVVWRAVINPDVLIVEPTR
ncbi:MAG: hypothetical protein AAGB29_07375 [Planctomycetota bacterium]